jgi:D-alanyl-D-alanine carboxypeptidase
MYSDLVLCCLARRRIGHSGREPSMRPRVSSLCGYVLALAVVLAVGVPTAAGAGRPARADRVQAALDRVVAAGAPGTLALVAGPRGVKAWAAGYAQLRPRVRMRPGDRFRIASVTKPFVATVVLQLVGEGVLSLDDTVERWLPGKVPNGAAITIRELLGHRSGLANPNASPDMWPPYFTGRPPGFQWTPDQLLALSTSQPAFFAPGTGFHYSNANFTVLRMIVEAATGTPLPAQLQRRVLGPLGMHSTSIDYGPGIRRPAAHGYVPFRIPGLRPVRGMTDTTVLSASVFWGAGDMSSTARDLARFFRALIDGRLLRPDLLDAMMNTPSGVRYGLGLDRVPSTSCGTVYGHNGEHVGYMIAAHITRDGRFSVWMMNRSDRTAVGAPPPKDIVAGARAIDAVQKAVCRS